MSLEVERCTINLNFQFMQLINLILLEKSVTDNDTNDFDFEIKIDILLKKLTIVM